MHCNSFARIDRFTAVCLLKFFSGHWSTQLRNWRVNIDTVLQGVVLGVASKAYKGWKTEKIVFGGKMKDATSLPGFLSFAPLQWRQRLTRMFQDEDLRYFDQILTWTSLTEVQNLTGSSRSVTISIGDNTGEMFEPKTKSRIFDSLQSWPKILSQHKIRCLVELQNTVDGWKNC